MIECLSFITNLLTNINFLEQNRTWFSYNGSKLHSKWLRKSFTIVNYLSPRELLTGIKTIIVVVHEDTKAEKLCTQCITNLQWIFRRVIFHSLRLKPNIYTCTLLNVCDIHMCIHCIVENVYVFSLLVSFRFVDSKKNFENASKPFKAVGDLYWSILKN